MHGESSWRITVEPIRPADTLLPLGRQQHEARCGHFDSTLPAAPGIAAAQSQVPAIIIDLDVDGVDLRASEMEHTAVIHWNGGLGRPPVAGENSSEKSTPD